jgi:hypothetical protein
MKLFHRCQCVSTNPGSTSCPPEITSAFPAGVLSDGGDLAIAHKNIDAAHIAKLGPS